MKGTDRYNKKILRIGFVILITMLLSINSFCQDYDGIYGKDYKSMKSLNIAGGLIGWGLGAEVWASIPIRSFIVTGSAGYKWNGTRDTMYTYKDYSYNRIISSDCKGPVYSLGFGFRIKRKEEDQSLFFGRYVDTQYKAYSVETTYSGNYHDIRSLFTTYFLVEASYRPTGVFKLGIADHGVKKYFFVPGNNFYLAAKLRFMYEIDNIATGTGIKNAKFIELSAFATPDVKHIGLYVNSSIINNFLNYSLGFGIMRRFDKPDEFDDPFDGDGMYKWSVPLQVTIGGSIYRRRKPDK